MEGTYRGTTASPAASVAGPCAPTWLEAARAGWRAAPGIAPIEERVEPPPVTHRVQPLAVTCASWSSRMAMPPPLTHASRKCMTHPCFSHCCEAAS